jgi:hypothetical protein
MDRIPRFVRFPLHAASIPRNPPLQDVMWTHIGIAGCQAPFAALERGAAHQGHHTPHSPCPQPLGSVDTFHPQSPRPVPPHSPPPTIPFSAQKSATLVGSAVSSSSTGVATTATGGAAGLGASLAHLGVVGKVAAATRLSIPQRPILFCSFLEPVDEARDASLGLATLRTGRFTE